MERNTYSLDGIRAKSQGDSCFLAEGQQAFLNEMDKAIDKQKAEQHWQF